MRLVLLWLPLALATLGCGEPEEYCHCAVNHNGNLMHTIDRGWNDAMGSCYETCWKAIYGDPPPIGEWKWRCVRADGGWG